MSTPELKLSSDAFCGAIVGKRRSGKTTLAIKLLRMPFFQRFSFIVWVSETAYLQEDIWIKQLHPDGILFTNYARSIGVITRLMDWQKAQSKKKRPHVLIIADDVGMHERTQSDSYSSVIDDIAFAGRHYHISTLFLAQRFAQISTGYRSQLDWMFWAGSGNSREVQAIFYEMTMGTDDLKTFKNKIAVIFKKPFTWLFFVNVFGIMKMEVL
jgi:hypothetical protein